MTMNEITEMAHKRAERNYRADPLKYELWALRLWRLFAAALLFIFVGWPVIAALRRLFS